METLWQDLKYGARVLLKTPLFTIIAVFTLALGVGGTSAIFSVVNGVLLRPLPYAEPERLVMMWEKAATMDTSVAYPNFVDWREQNQVFEHLAAFRRDSFNLTGAGEPERLQGRMVSASFFPALGVRPAAGRDFAAAEDTPGATPVVMLEHGFWQRRFGGDPGVVGQQITLNNRPFTVVGITPADFQFGAGADLFVPIGQWANEYQARGMHPGIYVIGRMKPNVSVEQARAELDTIMARLGQQYPETNAERRIHIETLYENTVGEVRRPLYILLGAVGFVLLIACANVANLLLARAATRQKEVAIRSALGASRRRVVRQFLTESVLLSVVGGGLGLLLAVWGTDLLVSVIPDALPRQRNIGVDLSVAAFTLAVSVLTGVIFGLLPALQASKPDLNETLKEGGRSSSMGGRQRLRSALVVAEVALALVLLVGAGLLLKSFWRLQEVETGFNPQGVLTMQLSVRTDPGEVGRTINFFSELEQRVQGLPGVEAVAFANGAPFLGAPESSFRFEGEPLAQRPEDDKMAVIYVVSPGYFNALGIRLVRGRYFTAQDSRNSQPVALIDEAAARLYFPNQDPIGRRLLDLTGMLDRNLQPGAGHDAGPNAPSTAVEIIGIVEHVKHYGLEGQVPVEAQMYYAFNQVPTNMLPMVARRVSMLVRTAGDPASLVPAVRQQIFAANSNQPVFSVKTMEQVISESIASRRFSMLLLIVFAAVALVLAGVGIYGVMSYAVTQRTHEIGVRLALGAPARKILKMVVGHALLLVAIGIGLGLAAAFALTRVMSSLLYGVSATDATVFLVVAAVLAAVALFASYIPARRATKVDPMEALRYE